MDALAIWLLDIVYDMYIPVRMILESRESVNVNLNTLMPCSSVEARLKRLRSLYEKQFILAEVVDILCQQASSTHAISPASFDSSFFENNPEEDILYRISLKGGKLWEKIVKPDWTLYYSDEINPASYESDSISIESSTQERINDILWWYEHCVGCKILNAQLHCEHLSPWNATYWKVLQGGRRTVSSISRIPDCKSAFPLNRKCELIKKWRQFGFNQTFCRKLVI
jgi:hypothetical protein